MVLLKQQEENTEEKKRKKRRQYEKMSCIYPVMYYIKLTHTNIEINAIIQAFKRHDLIIKISSFYKQY